MNRRTFLKSIAATAAALSLPFPDIETVDAAETVAMVVPSDTPITAPIDKVVTLDFERDIEFVSSGTGHSIAIPGPCTLTLRREYEQGGTYHKVVSIYKGTPTTAVLEAAARGDYSNFVETSHTWEAAL